MNWRDSSDFHVYCDLVAVLLGQGATLAELRAEHDRIYASFQNGILADTPTRERVFTLIQAAGARGKSATQLAKALETGPLGGKAMGAVKNAVLVLQQEGRIRAETRFWAQKGKEWIAYVDASLPETPPPTR